MRTFLLMLGSAVCGIVIFVASVYGYFWYQWSQAGPGASVRFPPSMEKTVGSVPLPRESDGFLGPQGSWAGEFPFAAQKTVLAEGAGKLVGNVTSGGKPLQGLRLRLALNGAAMSQWGTSGADGSYAIAVPYGQYRIDGYQLDSDTANRVLRGKIDSPMRHPPFRETVTVAEGKPGKGLDFRFVDPVRKTGPSGEVSVGQPVIVTWEPYPNASAYRLQLVEQKDPHDFDTHKRLFEWPKRPIVSATSANLAELGIVLKKGHYYAVEIEAIDERQRPLAEAPRLSSRPDFRVGP
jgi:hypothetical protein